VATTAVPSAFLDGVALQGARDALTCAHGAVERISWEIGKRVEPLLASDPTETPAPTLADVGALFSFALDARNRADEFELLAKRLEELVRDVDNARDEAEFQQALRNEKEA
jgi:hypothetical protein